MYSKMNKNTKSVAQCKKERSRRKRVMDLYEAGFTQEEISKRLAVSRKTVGRDLKKLHSYLQGLENQRHAEFADAMNVIFESKLRAYPEIIQFEWLTDMLCVEGNKKAEDRLLFEMLQGKYRPKRSW
jgi:predicted DNA-binding protein (UPF0251 family)